MAGGADPAAVLDIVSDNLLPHASGYDVRARASELVAALEVGGYRIVRAGMVPKLDELEHAESILRGVDEDLQRAPSLEPLRTAHQAGAAAASLRRLRELAVVVLGIDADDRDHPDGTDS